MNGLKTTLTFAKGITASLALFMAGAATGNDLDRAPGVSTAPPLSERLASVEPAARADATLEFEWLGEASSVDRALGARVVADWNEGRHDAALSALRVLEASGAGFGVGIAWSPPRAAGFAGPDVRIGGPWTGAQEVVLDSHGDVAVAVVQWGAGDDADWTVNISPDGGATWGLTYGWSSTVGIVDVDAVIVGDYLYVTYVAGESFISEARLRRCIASTGFVDIGFGYETVLDAAPGVMDAVAICGNPDDFDDRIYLFAVEGDGDLRYAWDVADDGKSFTELSTGVSGIAGGLAVTFVHNGTCDELQFISYRAPGQVLHIARRSAGELFETVYTATDVIGDTSISAYRDTVICAFEHRSDGLNDVVYRISYDCGGFWAYGELAVAESGVNYYEPKVTARGGQGVAAVYHAEAGAWDPVYLQTRSGYTGGPWSERVEVNDHDVVSGTGMAIQWMPPVCYGRGYGFAYITDIDDRIPYFDFAGSACLGDVNGDRTVDFADIVAMLAHWGAVEDDRADTNCDGVVDFADILEVLAAWGRCAE